MAIDFDRVLQGELAEIAARRVRAGVPVGALGQGASGSHDLDLVGLSLSGGGIRSASFSLGVLQALERADALRELDYLSTVSGGGYIGASLSAMANQPDYKEFPFAKSRSHDSPALVHFRSRINYLNPGALIDVVRLPALVLRGILLNILALTPWLLLAVLLTELAYVVIYNSGWFRYFSAIPLLLCAPFLALLITFPLVARFGRRGRAFRERYDRSFAGTLVLAGFGLVSYLVSTMVVWAVELPKEALARTLHGAAGRAAPMVIGALLLAYVLIRALAPGAAGKLRGLLLYGAGALVPLLFLGVYLGLCIVRINSPFFEGSWAEHLKRASDGAALPPEVRDGLAKRGVELANAPRVARCPNKERCWVVPDERGFEFRLIEREGKLAFEDLKFLIVFDQRNRNDHAFLALSLVVFLLYFFALDANSLSLHGFYRDCLSRMLLFRARPDGGVEPLDELRLSSLKPSETGAPYPLINATLNVQGATDAALRYRKGVAFTFSPRFIGSSATGYAPTAVMEAADPELTLASAMAISAAAAGPNMGSFTQRPLTLLLTLCNLRLGYWLPNPKRVATGNGPRKRPGPRHLLLEAFGAVNAGRSYVNVSDGGHFENLGAYELLRRRCRLIVVVDGEEDAQCQFNGLVTLMRLARIDLGVSISADLSDLRRTRGAFSERHWLWATLHYSLPDGREMLGHLLYVKASLSGDEPEHIRAYHARSPTFPHESTVDQFFNENQFESYRALGEHVGERALEDGRLLEKLRELRHPPLESLGATA